MGELASRIKYHFGFTKKEFIDLLIVSLIGGFIFSFRKWGDGTVADPMVGLRNLLISSIIVFIGMIIHLSVQRVGALKDGYKATFKTSYPSLLASIFIAIMTFGLVPTLFPGKMYLTFIPRLRVGEFRYGANYQELGKIAAMGVFSHVVLALLFKILLGIIGPNAVLEHAMFVYMILAITTFLPIPS